MSYAKPRRWVTKHRWGLIRGFRTGGFIAGFTGGVAGAIATGIPQVWLGGTMGGTIGGDILGRKVVRSLRTNLPKKTTYKVPRVRIPTVTEVATAPILIPFRIGESYGKAWTTHQKKLQARRQPVTAHAFVPVKSANPFIPKKNIFVR